MDIISNLIICVVGNFVYDLLARIAKDPFKSLTGDNGSDEDNT